MNTKKRRLYSVAALLCCALFMLSFAVGCEKTREPITVEITPSPATPAPNPSDTLASPSAAVIPATPLTPQEIAAIEEMVSYSGAFKRASLEKNAMLSALRRYVAQGARSVPEDFPTGISALYDYARDPAFVRREDENGPYLMRAEAAASFIFELYGTELPYAQADYFNAALNDWYCKNGEYRLYPQDTRWELRQSSYTIDEASGIYTLRLQNGHSAPSVYVRCKRALNRWGFTLLSVEDTTGLLHLPASTPAPQSSDVLVAAPEDTAEATPEAVPEGSPEATPEASPAAAPAGLPPAGSPVATAKPAGQNAVNTPALKGKLIGLDPGHQTKANRNMESVAPGSAEKKHKVSSGTVGTQTGVREYEINLKVALLLRDMLQNAGATVYMTRTENDVDISNAERAEFFNAHKVELGVRLHCNGSENKEKRGAFMLVPADKSYPYYNECVKAAQYILQSYGETTGLSTERGITYRSDQTGFNWCDRPVCNIEMGHLTNGDDEAKLVDAAFQSRMAQGIFNGIVRYFSE